MSTLSEECSIPFLPVGCGRNHLLWHGFASSVRQWGFSMPGKLGNKIDNTEMRPNRARPRTRSSAQAFARGFGGQTEKQTDGRSDAATPLASLAEVTGPSLHPGGTCLLGEPQRQVTSMNERDCQRQHGPDDRVCGGTIGTSLMGQCRARKNGERTCV